jgi:hypothetical protein
MKKKTPCYRNVGACIEGDPIRVKCQAKGKWKMIQKSNQHRGSYCIIKKDAKATILKSYTNLQK